MVVCLHFFGEFSCIGDSQLFSEVVSNSVYSTFAQKMQYFKAVATGTVPYSLLETLQVRYRISGP